MESEITDLSGDTPDLETKTDLEKFIDELGPIENWYRQWHVYLCDLGITSLPTEVKHLINVEHLYLYDNQLNSLPSEISYWTNIIRLDLIDNNLTTLPPEIYHLTKLTELILEGNQLISLSSDIKYWKNLHTLFLSQNCLTSLPPEIGYCTRLYYLDITDNFIDHLPLNIIKLTRLDYETFYMLDSRITSNRMIRFLRQCFPYRLKYLINHYSSKKKSKNLSKALGFDQLICDLIVLYL